MLTLKHLLCLSQAKMSSQLLPYTSTHGITPLLSLLLLADALPLSVSPRSLNPDDGTNESYSDSKITPLAAILFVIILFTGYIMPAIIWYILAYHCSEPTDDTTVRPACARVNHSRRAARWLNCAVCLNEVITFVTSQPKIKRFAKACGINLVEKKSWSDLPFDIINLIANRLYYTDQFRFRAVCKSWRVANIVRYADKLPWLVAHDYRQEMCYLYDPSHKREYTLLYSANSLHKFWDAKVLDTKQDWVLFSAENQNNCCRNALFFYNPFTDTIIELPEFSWELDNKIYTATFSTTPISEIFILCRSYIGGMISIIMYRPIDKNEMVFPAVHIDSWVQNFVYGDGFLYCFNSEIVAAFNVASKKWNILPRPSNNTRNEQFFFESDDDLIMSYLDVNIHSYRVFKLNRSQMDWYEIGSLEGKALFMTSSSRIMVPVEKESELANTTHDFNSASFKDYSLKFRNYLGGESMPFGPMVEDYKVQKIRKFEAFWIMPPQTRQ